LNVVRTHCCVPNLLGNKITIYKLGGQMKNNQFQYERYWNNSVKQDMHTETQETNSLSLLSIVGE